ncbi:TIGR04053 family radical SAM/SPASM domain-containing protein [Microaerobacter geothermalis]|uniref:TIGR04053 family radical SAM/SPASM domain-containing protein n=1 Tax=Microaerobacter geothermalis TaxID=674972 RepID=UPI001F3AD26C|nr:TIGR04053 family radical SAM/SPASM domain-containing protein [Microaerobacter geothermalis]MCF6092449.1 TIGR04053 family radical SAM/SPASM domain-containing protein [Microaerobacter geothermalis]
MSNIFFDGQEEFPDIKGVNRNRDYNQSPFIAIWEVTRACALKCLHCRAEAQYNRDPRELTFEEGKKLLNEIAAMDYPLLVFTGGDPLMREDIYDLAKYAIDIGLRVSMTPSATPKVTKKAIERAKEVGLSRWAFSLDGSTAEIHDRFRGTSGSFDLTMKAIQYLKELEIPLQINTTVSRYNIDDLDNIAQKLEDMGTVLWSVFFLVPTGRGKEGDMISPVQHEQVFNWLYDLSKRVPFDIKTTAAQHYRRVVLQRKKEENPGVERTFSEVMTGKQHTKDGLGRAPKGVNDGNGFVFISHIGDVYPSGLLPINCGNVREQSLSSIYRDSPVFQALRNPSGFKGKCGVCEYRNICGGSRARAYAMSGDYLESEPFCTYIPKGYKDSL